MLFLKWLWTLYDFMTQVHRYKKLKWCYSGKVWSCRWRWGRWWRGRGGAAAPRQWRDSRGPWGCGQPSLGVSVGRGSASTERARKYKRWEKYNIFCSWGKKGGKKTASEMHLTSFNYAHLQLCFSRTYRNRLTNPHICQCLQQSPNSQKCDNHEEAQ